MKIKKLLISLVLLLQITTILSQTYKLIQLDQSFDYSSTGTNPLTMQEHSVFTYDSNNRNSQTEYYADENYDGTILHVLTKTITYGAGGLITQIDYLYDDMQRSNIVYYTYTPVGQIQFIETKKYNTTTLTYENYQKQSFSYQNSSSTKPLTIIFQEWDSGAWHTFRKYIYTYDANQNVLTGIKQEGNSPNYILQNVMKFIKTYDSSQRMASYEIQNWNVSFWDSNYKLIYTYNTNQMIYEFYNGSTILIKKTVFDFDNNGDLLSQKNYDLVGGSWIKNNKTEYTYNGNTIFVNNHNADTATDTWKPSYHKREYYYDMTVPKTDLALPIEWDLPENFYFPTLLQRHAYPYFDQFKYKWEDFREYWRNDTTQPFGEVANGDLYYDNTAKIDNNKPIIAKVYPNPVDDYLMIKTKNEDYDIKIFNYAGKLVFVSENNKSSEKINLEQLKKGIYFYKLKTINGLQVGKIIKD